MQLKIITGSHRVNSASERVGAIVADLAGQQNLFDRVSVLNLHKQHLPEWSESYRDKSSKDWLAVREQAIDPLKEDDAFVVISPEYSGMVPSALKNFFLLCSDNELAHKPALLVAVSGGAGGSYPIAELRMSSYKNTRICYIPDHVIIRNAESFLADPQPTHPYERLHYCLKILKLYTTSLGQVRQSGQLDYERFPFGM